MNIFDIRYIHPVYRIRSYLQVFYFSRRVYSYAVNWRENGEGQSKSYFYTKTYDRPLDVPSDEEPELEADLEYWQGQRVERAPVADHERSVYLGLI